MAQNYGTDWEFLLVDDVSTDKTAEIIKRTIPDYPNVKYIPLKKRGGQTGCFKAGFDKAKGKIVITMDGDLQVLPEDIPLFVEKMRQGYDVVNGIREHRQHNFGLRLASRIFNLLMLLLFNCPVLDAASNFTSFKSKFIKNLRLTDNDHRYIIPIAVRRGAKRIGEVVIQHRQRKAGKPKYKLSKKAIKGGPEIILAWMRYKSGRYDL